MVGVLSGLSGLSPGCSSCCSSCWPTNGPHPTKAFTDQRLTPLAVGLLFVLVVALFFGGLACLEHLVLRGLLAYNGFAPLGYVGFLNEATDRLFLRRAGSGYLFVHRLLLEYFASQPGNHPSARQTERSAAHQVNPSS